MAHADDDRNIRRRELYNKKADRKKRGHSTKMISFREFIELDELSKKTLGSYVKKAVVDVSTASMDLGARGATGREMDTRQTKKFQKRLRGTMRVADKLAK